jgi:hypothetical protein
MIYPGTLVALIVIILFSELLKFSKKNSSNSKKLVKENIESSRIFLCQNKMFKINKLFNKHVLKLPRYYSIKPGGKSDQQEHTQLSCGANKHKLRNLGFIVDFLN